MLEQELKKLINDICSNNKKDKISIEEKILGFCNTPKSKEEIAGMLNINSAYYIVTKYLKPLVEKGELGMTIPEKPKSKFQKYYQK